MKGSIARKYAKALFEVSKEENLSDEILREINELEKTLDKEIMEFLSLPTVVFEHKVDLIKDLQERLRFHPFITNTLLLLVEKNKARYIPVFISYYTQLYMEEKGYVVAEVKTARELNEFEEEALKERIKEWSGKEVFLKKEVDKEIIGGIIIKIGDLLIDNSILKKMRNFVETFKGE